VESADAVDDALAVAARGAGGVDRFDVIRLGVEDVLVSLDGFPGRGE
jgi:hypothetical protein